MEPSHSMPSGLCGAGNLENRCRLTGSAVRLENDLGSRAAERDWLNAAIARKEG